MATSMKGDIDTPEYIILKDHLADVIDLLAGNAPVITQFSNHLFSSNLIPKEVHLDPKSSPLDRASQLINSVFFTIGTHSDPSSVFRALVTSLEKVGLTDMAMKLQQSLGVKSHIPQPFKAAVAKSPTVIQLSSEDEVTRNIDKLYDQFTDLVTDLRTRFEELISEGKIKLILVIRQAAEYLRRSVTSLQANSIDELFDSLQPHYDFLNCSLLRKLTNRFLASDTLQSSILQYIDCMDKLLELSQLKHIRSAIKEKLSFLPTPTINEHTALIVFKLHGRWEEMTLKNFKRVLAHYFQSDADLFTHILFDYGSLIVKMLIPTSILQFVTNRLSANRDSINRLGIFQVAINGKTMLSIDNTDIDFENSLMDSGDDFEAMMLVKLGANCYDATNVDKKYQCLIEDEDKRFHKAKVAWENLTKALLEAIDRRKGTIKHLQNLIEEKDKHQKEIARVTAAKVAGYTLGIAGVATGFVAFGLGFGLTVAGASIAGASIAAGRRLKLAASHLDITDLMEACERDREQAGNIEEYGDELDSHLKALASKYKMSKESIFGYLMSTKGSLAPGTGLTTSYSDFYVIIKEPKPSAKGAEANFVTVKKAFCIGNVVMDVVFVPINLSGSFDGIKSMIGVLEKNLEEMVLFLNELNKTH